MNILVDSYNSLYVSGSAPGVLYGLPKTHKPGQKMRPILSTINTPSYRLCKFLVPIIEPLTQNNYTLKDSFQFADLINSSQYAQFHMASFDVESLFTNIPVKETVSIICEDLFKEESNVYGLNKTQFTKLLSLAVENTIFTFDNQFYKQTDGMAMGSPLGPTFANAFLCKHENAWLNDCPEVFKPVLYRRYVDDCFLLFREQHHIPEFLNYLNSRHNNIKFTAEHESDNRLAFLDVLVTRSNNILSTSIYRKPSTTMLGTNFFSGISHKFKLASLKCGLHRAFRISSNWTLFHEEVDYLKRFAAFNKVPKYIFERLVRLFLNRTFSVKNTQYEVPKLRKYVKLPYLGSLTKTFTMELRAELSKCYPYVDFCLIPVNNQSIGSFLSHKERLPGLFRSSVVYKYKCASCTACYVGKTTLQLKLRIYKHRGVSHYTGRPITDPEFSNIRNHQEGCPTVISEEDFSILATTKCSNLNIMESLFIESHQPQLNAQQCSSPLYVF